MVKGTAAIITINAMRHATVALWQVLVAAEHTNSARKEKFAYPSQ
jgi:hypothetical protein